jgi:protoporphyrinogen oxidase
MDVGVVGGGITGLACAHYLLRHGLRPIVFEATWQFGHLSAKLRHRNTTLEAFHAPLRRSDTALCGLVSDLGLDHLLRWRQTTRGVVLPDGRQQSFSCSADLLRWPGLSLRDRLRAVSASYAALRFHGSGRALDDITAVDWLVRLYGKRTYEQTWRPVLAALFSPEYAEEVPAYRAWLRLRQELGRGKAIRGYLRGGIDLLCQKLAKSIVERGGEVHLGTPVHRFEASAERVVLDLGEKEVPVDAVVLTPALAELASLGGSFEDSSPWTPALDKRSELSLVSALVLMRAEPRPFYSTLALHPEAPFQVVTDGGQLMPSDVTHGLRPLYLKRFCHPVAGTYRVSNEVWSKQAVETLHALDPKFDASAIERVEIFRAPGVDPAWPVGSLGKRAAARSTRGPVYLCTSDQTYPREPGPESQIMQAREVVTRLANEL